MSKEGKAEDPKLPDGANQSHKGFIWLCVAVACIWVVFTLVIYWLFSDWQTRGTVGDSFGAVNALFSGLAFAGVLYALTLQRRELAYQREEMLATRKVSEAQLAEMKASRELLAQPLAIPTIQTLQIERPRFFYSPPEDEHSAQARYSLSVALNNPTQHPAIGVNVRSSIVFGEPKIELRTTDCSLSIIAPSAVIDEPATQPDFLFSGDSSGQLFESVRQHDPRKVPVIVVEILFKNIVGAHFRLVQAFNVYASAEHIEALRIWHTGIVGFHARYKHELAQLCELKRKGKDNEWDELFQRIKLDFAASVPGEEEIGIRALAVPASFSLQNISGEEFRKNMETASYSQIINALYDCPAELDARK